MMNFFKVKPLSSTSAFRVTNAHFIRKFFFSFPGKEVASYVTFMGRG